MKQQKVHREKQSEAERELSKVGHVHEHRRPYTDEQLKTYIEEQRVSFLVLFPCNIILEIAHPR
jgi:hypothetical protein